MPRLLRGLHGARRGHEEELVQAAEACIRREEHAGSREGEARTGERNWKYNSTLLFYFVNNFSYTFLVLDPVFLVHIFSSRPRISGSDSQLKFLHIGSSYFIAIRFI